LAAQGQPDDTSKGRLAPQLRLHRLQGRADPGQRRAEPVVRLAADAIPVGVRRREYPVALTLQRPGRLQCPNDDGHLWRQRGQQPPVAGGERLARCRSASYSVPTSRPPTRRGTATVPPLRAVGSRAVPPRPPPRAATR
jgi:hypothetical protein